MRNQVLRNAARQCRDAAARLPHMASVYIAKAEEIEAKIKAAEAAE